MALCIMDNGSTIQETDGECLRIKLKVINTWATGNKIESMGSAGNSLQ